MISRSSSATGRTVDHPSGWLKLLEELARGRWQWRLRWFELDRETCLLTYSMGAGDPPIGMVPLSVVSALRSGAVGSSAMAAAAAASGSMDDLTLVCNAELYRLRAPSADVAALWLDALRTVVAAAAPSGLPPPREDPAAERAGGSTLEAAAVTADDPHRFPDGAHAPSLLGQMLSPVALLPPTPTLPVTAAMRVGSPPGGALDDETGRPVAVSTAPRDYPVAYHGPVDRPTVASRAAHATPLSMVRSDRQASPHSPSAKGARREGAENRPSRGGTPRSASRPAAAIRSPSHADSPGRSVAAAGGQSDPTRSEPTRSDPTSRGIPTSPCGCRATDEGHNRTTPPSARSFKSEGGRGASTRHASPHVPLTHGGGFGDVPPSRPVAGSQTSPVAHRDRRPTHERYSYAPSLSDRTAQLVRGRRGVASGADRSTYDRLYREGLASRARRDGAASSRTLEALDLDRFDYAWNAGLEEAGSRADKVHAYSPSSRCHSAESRAHHASTFQPDRSRTANSRAARAVTRMGGGSSAASAPVWERLYELAARQQEELERRAAAAADERLDAEGVTFAPQISAKSRDLRRDGPIEHRLLAAWAEAMIEQEEAAARDADEVRGSRIARIARPHLPPASPASPAGHLPHLPHGKGATLARRALARLAHFPPPPFPPVPSPRPSPCPSPRPPPTRVGCAAPRRR